MSLVIQGEHAVLQLPLPDKLQKLLSAEGRLNTTTLSIYAKIYYQLYDKYLRKMPLSVALAEPDEVTFASALAAYFNTWTINSLFRTLLDKVYKCIFEGKCEWIPKYRDLEKREEASYRIGKYTLKIVASPFVVRILEDSVKQVWERGIVKDTNALAELVLILVKKFAELGFVDYYEVK